MSANDCSYMTDDAFIPFCRGCGHTHILNKLNDALIKLKLNPNDVCLVTDIGCIGLADALFDKIHTVHTTHGRSTGFATGIAIADKILGEKKLKTIVLIGDGGSMIGLLHIVNAALMNVDVTVIVANNFLFGMTGGQQSSLTPEHFKTQTTPFGSMNPALDICAIAEASKAGYIARKTSTDKDLADIFSDAVSHDGFAIVEVLELCTEHAVKLNNLKGNELLNLAAAEGQKTGIIKKSIIRKEFSRKYSENIKGCFSEKNAESFITSIDEHNISGPIRIILSGSAGERVQSSAGLLCKAALHCGLHTTQKNDNPITQGSGFSLSEIIISPEDICYTGVDIADFVIITSADGLKESEAQNIYNRTSPDTIFIVDDSVKIGMPGLKIICLPLRKYCGSNKAALGAADYFIRTYKPFPHRIFRLVIEGNYGEYKKIFKKEYYND